MRLEFDPEDPPATAPGNAHPTLWALAWHLHQAHQPGADTWCIGCRDPREMWPCPASRIAHRGFLLALDLQQQTG